MRRKPLFAIVFAGMTMLSAGGGRADVPAPPVNQALGMPDVVFGSLTEADCRACHDVGVPDRHHLLYGQGIPEGSIVPHPDADGDGEADTIYSCASCHGQDFAVVRDCTQCHTRTPHHTTARARAGDCVSCHGDVVDGMDDGHYIPDYAPSLVTPTVGKEGNGLPLNSYGTNAGGCAYCHDGDDPVSPTVIQTNATLHHYFGADRDCTWCHNVFEPFSLRIRGCENCHGPDSLHNIQTDSPNEPAGTIVVGGEDAGYGHVGRDAGPGDSDCWGCHGFAVAMAPRSGPLIPTIYSADLATIKAGADTTVVLTGSAFTNVAAGELFESGVSLTGADGSSVVLTPDLVDQGSLVVTIPGDTAPGNYDVRAVKAEFASNPAAVSIVPRVVVTKVVAGDTVRIRGSGFGGYAEGSEGSFVTAKVPRKSNKRNATRIEVGKIISWTDTKIEAEFSAAPTRVTVFSIFGSASSKVADGGRKRR